jgi:hypothetical protein
MGMYRVDWAGVSPSTQWRDFPPMIVPGQSQFALEINIIMM